MAPQTIPLPTRPPRDEVPEPVRLGPVVVVDERDEIQSPPRSPPPRPDSSRTSFPDALPRRGRPASGAAPNPSAPPREPARPDNCPRSAVGDSRPPSPPAPSGSACRGAAPAARLSCTCKRRPPLSSGPTPKRVSRRGRAPVSPRKGPLESARRPGGPQHLAAVRLHDLPAPTAAPETGPSGPGAPPASGPRDLAAHRRFLVSRRSDHVPEAAPQLVVLLQHTGPKPGLPDVLALEGRHGEAVGLGVAERAEPNVE